jgi:hypothetical protein
LSKLFDTTLDGYSALASLALRLNSPSFVVLLYRLLFLGTWDGKHVRKPKCLRLLLWLFSEAQEQVKDTALSVMEFAVDTHYQELQDIEPFVCMFQHFDAVSLVHRNVILRTLSHVCRRANLLTCEWRAVVELLHSTRASSVLVVAALLSRLLEEGVLHPRPLQDAGVLSMVISLLVPPEVRIDDHSWVQSKQVSGPASSGIVNYRLTCGFSASVFR